MILFSENGLLYSLKSPKTKRKLDNDKPSANPYEISL